MTDVAGVPAIDPSAVVARLEPHGAGKDSTTGHWELMGVVTKTPFPLYPEGFPRDVLLPFTSAIGRPVLGNRPASGTAIIEQLGEEHLRTGAPIVYTSGDSVFQVAAHTRIVPLETLYAWCAEARAILKGPHRVGRVIARPFDGEPGAFRRTLNRRDFTVEPPGTTVCDLVHDAGVPVRGVGKIGDLFAGRGISESEHTPDNSSSIQALAGFLEIDGPGLVFANLVDFDQLYGHRNDPVGYAGALEELDRSLGEAILPRMRAGDRLLLTGDHGTDPTITTSTDHTRERVPLLAWGPDLRKGRDLAIRDMVDVGATVLDLLGVRAEQATSGTSLAPFLDSSINRL
jgi:phosphopentomutase